MYQRQGEFTAKNLCTRQLLTSTVQCKDVPIAFLAHDIGGFVVKKASRELEIIT